MKIIRKSDGAVFERDDEGRLASDRKGTGWDNQTGTYYGDSIEIVRTGTKGGAPDLYKQYRQEVQDAAEKRPGGFGNYGFGGSQNTKFNVLDYLGTAGKNLLHGMAEGAAATGAFAENKVADAAGWLFGDKELAKSMKETGLFNSLYHGNEDLHLEGIEKERERTAREMERNISGIQTGNETADRALRWAAKAGGDVSYSIGNALPMAAEALAGGPAAWPGVAESADDLVRMGASVVEKSGVLNTLSTAARNMLSSREYWTAFVSEIGSDYMDALNKGASEDDATAYALATALVNSGIEVGGGIQNGGADPLWKSSIEEGREEIDQGVTGRMMENIFLHRNNPLFSTKDEDAIINPVTALKEGAMGAAVGGILSAGQRGIASAVNNRAENNAYRDVYGADSESLVQEALELDPENKTAQEAQKRLDQGKQVPARMIRQMVEENEARIQETGAEQNAGESDSRGPVDLKTAEDTGEITEDGNGLPRRSAPRNDAGVDFLTQRAGDFGDAAQDFLEARQSGQDPETYYSGFQAAYLYGKANSGTTGQIDTETREELRQATGLTDGQIDLAYNLGRAEVNRQDNADPRGAASLGMTEEGAEQYGAEQAEGVRVRDGGQRFDGTDPRGPAEAVAEGTGGAEVRQAQSRAADRGAAAFTYAREGRSTAQLIGGSRGSSTDSLRIVTGGKSASVQQAEQIVKDRGLTPHLFAGDNLTVTNSGKTVKARGFIQGKNVFVRADDPHFTADQIARHEVGHDMIAGGEIDVEDVRKRLREKFTQKELDAVAELYADLYAGSGLSEAEIWEEIICDSLGDMNVFEDTWAAEKAPVDAVLREAKTEAVRQQENDRGPPNGQKNTAHNEGGKMSQVLANELFNDEFQEDTVGLIAVLKSSMDDLANMESVADVAGVEVPASGSATSRALTYIRGLKEKIVRKDFGEVLFSKTKIKNSFLGHGFGEAKVQLMAAVPGVIQKGKQIAYAKNWKNRGYDSFVFAGPAEYDGKKVYVAAIVIRDNANRYYLHEAVDESGNVIYKQKESPEPASDRSPGNPRNTVANPEPSIGILPQSTENINRKNADGKTSRTSDSLENLRRENEELRKAFAEQQRQLRKTEKKLADTRENRDNWRNKATFHPERVARDIIRAYEGTVKETEIHDGVKALIDYAARKEGVSFDKMKEMALPVAQQIVSSAETVVNGEEARTWADIKKYHKDHKIRVSTEALRDFADWGDADTDFKTEFRKKYGRPLNLTSGQDGVPIDVAYAEMAEMFGEVYYPGDITHPADQLRRMAEVRENLQPVMENPYSLNMAMATEHCANELVDTVMKAVALGYGSTYSGRLAEQLYQSRQDSRRMLEQERQRSADQMKALKDHWKEQKAREYERRQDSEERDRLLKIARRMQNKKLPAVQRGLIDQYIKDLDTVSRKLTGKTIYDLVSLEHWYQERKQNDPDFIPDEATEKRIHRLYERHVDDLSREEVLDLTYALLNIENQIKTEKDLIESREKRDIFEAGLAVMRNIENSPGSKASGVRSAIDRLVVTETLSPLRQVRRMTGYADGDPLVTLTDELAAGQRAMFDYQRRALDRFKAFVEDKAFTKEITGKDAREIEIRGLGKDGPVTVKITPAMRISLYLHSKNPQNLQHIAGGGIRVPDMKLYKKGKIQEAYARGTVIKLTPSEVRAIVGQMTARERRFADMAHDYFNSTSKDAINAVSEKLKGYPVAEVENYFPISTDDSFTRKDFESIKFDGSIEGMGFLKERVKSSSPVYLRDLNSVLTQAIDMHAKYVGLAVPVRNFNKLWGVTAHNVTENGDLGASSSVQSTVRQQWGEEGRRYIEKMMSDLQQGGREQSVYARELSKVRSAYAGAVLTLNASVAMKQAASYPTAAAVVGWKPLMAAMKNVGKVDLDLIAAYTPLQWYRSRGFSTQELGDMAKRGKQLLPALNWVQGADLLTTRKLWKAAEIYVRDNFKTLERGSAEEIRAGKSPFYQKVAEVYNRIIEETQPNYTTMQRPQLLRSDDTLLQNLQMFKTQPFQNFNILYDALGNLAAKERAWKSSQTEESRAALREAKRNAAWAVSSQAVQLAVFAAMTLAWNAFRGKRDKYEDKDGDVSFLSVLKGLGLDMISGLFSEIPFGGDVWALGTSVATGGKYYGVTDVTTSALTDAGTALVNAGKTLSGLVKDIGDPEKEPDFNSVRLKLDSVADATSKALGIPYENVLNLGKAVFRHGAKWLEGDYMGQYRYLQLTTDPGGSYKGDYYDLLWQAYRKDMEAHRTLYRQMVADGWDPEKIKDAMEKRMKDEQGVRSVKDLKSRYQAP